MEDKSIFTKGQPKEISEGLQNFINSMVEEIVLEGKPFGSQKKYLKKFSENEGVDYDNLVSNINTFIKILGSLKKNFNKLQIKLAEEKGRECHISEKTLQKLVNHSSQPDQPQEKSSIPEETGLKKKTYLKHLLLGCFGLVMVASTLFLGSRLRPVSQPETIVEVRHDTVTKYDTVTVEHVQIQHDTVIKIQYSNEAEQKYRVDAERGDATAQFNLGCYYYSGEKGLPQSYSEAVKWYTKAANQGYAPAQNNLGYCYEKGYGISQSLLVAKKWYEKAAAQGNSTAKKNGERIKRMEAEKNAKKTSIANTSHNTSGGEATKISDSSLKVSAISKATLTGTESGHEWVDLGLPSGIRWATMNVGANLPTETGSYFSWGETAAKKSYKWKDYKFRTGGSDIDDIKLSKYNTGVSVFWAHKPKEAYYGPVDNRTQLEPIDDAARQIWKGSWRIPTKDDFLELINYCNIKWTVLEDGKAGIEVTGRSGMHIFLRAAGYWSSALDCVNLSGEYWSASLDEDETYCAYMLYFYKSSKPYVGNDWRRLHGRSIRPVLDVK